MGPAAILEKIAANPHLPTPPAIALQAMQLANQPTCTIRDLGRLIACDPSLSARILRLVNSSLYGSSRSITSIDRALNLLGLKRLRSLVLGLSLPALRFRTASGARMRAYWQESVARAVIAREVAVRLRWDDPETEMMTGLLCDLGTLLLQETFPQEYEAIVAQPPEILARSQCEMEEAAIGVDHALVGAHVLAHWGLPEAVTEPIRDHHAPARRHGQHSDRAYLLYFATRVAQLRLTLTRASVLEEISHLARERFGMDGVQFVGFLDSLQARIDEFASLIDVRVEPSENFRELYVTAMENLTRFAVEMSEDLLSAQEEKTQAVQGLQRAEEALRIKDQQLLQAQKMEAVGRLAGGVAHDFNNLLTIILGYSDLLLHTLPPQDPARGSIEIIKGAGDRAAALTRQLLAFSRRQVLVPEVFDLNNTVSGMVEMLRRVIGKGVEIVTRLNPSLPRIKADPGQIEQIVMNLAVNARDAMPQGGRLTLETHSLVLGEIDQRRCPELRPGPHVLLVVSDTGVGMDADTLEHLFEPFFTTKERGRGTGLGLATVHGIVKQSGGHVEVQSTPGEGTTFRVYLPVSHERAVPARAERRPDDLLRGSETVLLVEDEAEIRAIGRRTLQMYGYKVLEACDGAEAVEVSRRHAEPIHLLVADTLLPNTCSYDLARRLTSDRPGLRVLFTTGFSDDTALTIADTGTHYLQKPFTPRGLAQKAREVLA